MGQNEAKASFSLGGIDHVLEENSLFIASVGQDGDTVLDKVFPLDQCDFDWADAMLLGQVHPGSIGSQQINNFHDVQDDFAKQDEVFRKIVHRSILVGAAALLSVILSRKPA